MKACTCRRRWGPQAVVRVKPCGGSGPALHCHVTDGRGAWPLR